MTHEQLRELASGYALDILDEAEHRAFEAHLATCRTCAEEVDSFRSVASGLALAAPQVNPPAGLRARVLSGLRTPALAHLPAAAGKPGNTKAGAFRRVVLPGLAAAATLAALALALYAVALHRRIDTLEDALRRASAGAEDSRQQLVQLRASAEQAAEARRILSAPDLRRIDLAGQKAAPGASGRAFWSPSQGLVVAFRELPALPADRVYQLWVIPPGAAPRSAGLLQPEATGRALALAAPELAARVGTVAVTREPAGGVPAPTGDMIVAGAASN